MTEKIIPGLKKLDERARHAIQNGTPDELLVFLPGVHGGGFLANDEVIKEHPEAVKTIEVRYSQ